MNRKLLKLEDPGLQDLATEALSLWLPTASFLYEPMPPGRSGAALISVDVSGNTGELAPGTYVLRVGPAGDDLVEASELAAHQLIRDTAPGFAERHVPSLLRIHQRQLGDVRLVASLHQLAGDSLTRYVSPHSQSTNLSRATAALSHDLLSAWADPHVVEPMRPYDVLRTIAGDARVAACLEATRLLFDGELYQEDGHVFRNPRAVFSETAEATLPIMQAVCHGDLHTGNLLVRRDEVDGNDDDFWIVDLDQARSRCIAGFDLAYLEVSVLVNIGPVLRTAVLARCLEAAEDPAVRSVPDGCQWLVELFTQSRSGIHAWIADQPGRMDLLYQQITLTRIAAALLWARRLPAADERVRTCLAYAGWYTMWYTKKFPHAVAPSEIATAASVAGNETSPTEQQARDELWESFWDTVSGFSPHGARYLLIAEQMPRAPSVAALGRIPWSLIVDLDPESDGDGLRHLAGPVLDAQRAVHLFTDERPAVDYARGTAWLLAVGSVLRREAALEGREWVIQRLDTVRRLTAAFRQANGDTPVCVVVLEGGMEAAPKGGRDRLLRVIESMDEMLRGQATFLHVGLARLDAAVPMVRIPLPVPELLDRLAETLGTAAEYRDYAVPAIDRSTAAISPETMQKLREYLVVLHDSVEVTPTQDGDGQNDAFWRGGLISWADLDRGQDVVRSVNDGLVGALRESLDQHRTRTVLLEHQPGAGGTTAALRAAWDLHHEYPVAVLPYGFLVDSPRVPLIADRLQLLYAITQMPVLLVAEAGDMSESYREVLYRELASRNTPVTMLYVRRGLGLTSRGALYVSDPLNDTETAEFFRRYTSLASDEGRANELRLLSTEPYERYRTPFFYGLITFEREFTKLSTYVRTHLDQVRGHARDVMQLLALVTIFSNTGPQRELVQKLMNISAPSAELDPSDVLGPAAARLVTVRSGRVRLQHQLLAEQVLAELLNDEHWQRHLKDLAIDLIQALVSSTDVSSEPVRALLRQMFVDRQGGTVDGVEDRRKFAPLIEMLDLNSAHQVLKSLTENVPDEPHFWNHLGRHQMYRLNRELDKAEEYVARAVALAESDFLHHHTLGLARRSRMRQALRDAKRRGVQPVMAATDRWFAQTIECFTTTRKLNPDNIYGYITHVQTVVDVAKAIKEAARVSSVAQLNADASDWVAEHLSDANFLLSEAAELYGTLDRRDDYLVRCQADIKRLYGDLDSVVELWELAVAGNRSTPMMQRALAQAYYVRGGRSWQELGRPELQRIVELAYQNLAKIGCKEEDYRLWFEAYKLLPDFDVDEALSQLQLWSDRFPSWRAHYYRSCLYFHLWFTNRSNDAETYRMEQQLAEKYIVGRSKRSYLWLSAGPEWYPMIADTDLGEWNRKANFWSHTAHLQRVNGVIDYMRGPQAGTIKLDGPISAFFVPSRGNFLPDSDENAPVNFFLGLSPEGPRAWDVRRGHVDYAVYARQSAPAHTVQPLVHRERVEVAPAQIAEHAAMLARQRKLDFCVALLEAWRAVGNAPRLSQLLERVSARFRYDGEDVRQLLVDSPRIRLDADDDDPVVELDSPAGSVSTHASAPAHQSRQRLGRVSYVNEAEGHGIIELAESGWARFTFGDIRTHPAADPTPLRAQIVRIDALYLDKHGGMNARGIELLAHTDTLVDGDVLHADQLGERVLSDLRVQMEEWLAKDVALVPVRDVNDWLENRFAGCRPLSERLGVQSLDQFLDGLGWLRRSSDRGKRMLGMSGGKVFGRVPLTRSGTSPQNAAGTVPDRFREALESVVTEIQRKYGNRPPKLFRVKKALMKELGETYAEVVGGSLKYRIEHSPGWTVSGTEPLDFVVDRTGTGTSGRPVGQGAFASALADAVRTLSARGQEPVLARVELILRQTLGSAYDELVGASLKQRVEKESGWRLDKVRSDTFVLRPAKQPPRPSPAPPEPYVGSYADAHEVDVAAELEAIAQEMEAQGRALLLPAIGNALRSRLGAQTYRNLTQARRLGPVVKSLGWEIYELRPGTEAIRRGDHQTPSSEG